MSGIEAFAERVQWAGSDIPVYDAERAQSQNGEFLVGFNWLWGMWRVWYVSH
jgi:hypothetical protein